MGRNDEGGVVDSDVDETWPAFNDKEPARVPEQDGRRHKDPAEQDVELEA